MRLDLGKNKGNGYWLFKWAEGFSSNTRQVPINPIIIVAKTATAVVPSAGRATKTKPDFIPSETTAKAAPVPANKPNKAAAKPIKPYSMAKANNSLWRVAPSVLRITAS